VRQVLEAIPPELDDRKDSIVRMVVEGYGGATDLAATEQVQPARRSGE
jgi:hypothetical protein